MKSHKKNQPGIQLTFRAWLKCIQMRKYELLLGLPPCECLFWLIYSADSNESFICVTWSVFACKMSFETSVVGLQNLKKSQFSKLSNGQSDSSSVIASSLENGINAHHYILQCAWMENFEKSFSLLLCP